MKSSQLGATLASSCLIISILLGALSLHLVWLQEQNLRLILNEKKALVSYWRRATIMRCLKQNLALFPQKVWPIVMPPLCGHGFLFDNRVKSELKIYSKGRIITVAYKIKYAKLPKWARLAGKVAGIEMVKVSFRW